MKAVIFQSKNKGLQLKEIQKPVPKKGELLIRLHYAGLNHLDLWIWKEEILENPVISGSDGSGIVADAGEGVDRAWIGKEVIINPSLYWGDNENVFGDKFEILGMPSNGTFAEYIAVSPDYVHEKPTHLSLKQAAALPLAALTAYRALFTKARIRSSDNVLVTGIGGGAAQFLLQMATATGASVYVSSSSEEKMRKAIALGAKGSYNYRDENWVEKAKAEAGGFDVIVDSAGGNGFAQLTEAANAGARIVLFGRTAGNIHNLRPGLIFNKQLQILGTVMGTRTEFTAMLEFYSEHKLYPVLDREFNLENVCEAADYMKAGHHFGKIIVNITESRGKSKQ